MDLLNVREKVLNPIKDFEEENKEFLKGVYPRRTRGEGGS